MLLACTFFLVCYCFGTLKTLWEKSSKFKSSVRAPNGRGEGNFLATISRGYYASVNRFRALALSRSLSPWGPRTARSERASGVETRNGGVGVAPRGEGLRRVVAAGDPKGWKGDQSASGTLPEPEHGPEIGEKMDTLLFVDCIFISVGDDDQSSIIFSLRDIGYLLKRSKLADLWSNF